MFERGYADGFQIQANVPTAGSADDRIGVNSSQMNAKGMSLGKDGARVNLVKTVPKMFLDSLKVPSYAQFSFVSQRMVMGRNTHQCDVRNLAVELQE